MAYPSTFADLQSAVKIRARLDTTGLDDEKVKDWINRAYTRAVLDSEMNVTYATMTLTANTFSYTLPSAVARIKTMWVLPAGQVATTFAQPPMKPTSLEDIVTRRQTGQLQSQAGIYCTLYCLKGAFDFEVWPTPAAADVITIFYAAIPTALVNGTDVPIIEEPYASDLLEYGALVYAGDLLGDPSTEEWAANYQQALGEYMGHLAAKAGDIPSQFHQWGSIADTEELYGWPY